MKKYQISLAIIVSCLLGWGFTYLSIEVFEAYQFGLFVWLPLVMGLTSTIILGYKNPESKKYWRNIAFISLLIYCFGLLITAFEGIICLIMAAPIGFLFNYIGYRIGRAILTSENFGKPPTVNILFVLSVPLLMAFENKIRGGESSRSVATSVVIKASAETVWQNVVMFPQLDAPTEWLFKTGIAYPIHATIKGDSVGAMRYCNFSTGAFVEPITTWDKPNLLQFDVIEQPEPMKEWSFKDIHPNHLHGYWVSQKGQFKLTRLENGNILLEGTTWYVNKIKPDWYWTLWSDYIVHKIHTRVLEHIKKVSEQ